MRRDRSDYLYYAPLQGTTAEALLPLKLRQALSTAVYKKIGTPDLYLQSDAVLYALIDIKSRWRFCAKIALWIPKGLRDTVYAFIARHRLKLFPKGACPLPSEGVRQRMLP